VIASLPFPISAQAKGIKMPPKVEKQETKPEAVDISKLIAPSNR